ncbi:hypothetical protein [Acidithiobacillus ferriphilus]|uniref:hypothetical protein n=1 Tax=Acidithiobacillus ferriphilus TaxID=1689834 RepID=UPI002DB5B5A8|nr:hypothetical protein [Acidithiobacillus ferriphilus]MEB8476713.1 hypothetical protein [Acidithiobacillus ferriphilus]
MIRISIKMAHKTDKAFPVYGAVFTEFPILKPGAEECLTFWCGLMDGPLNISAKTRAMAEKRYEEQRAGGYQHKMAFDLFVGEEGGLKSAIGDLMGEARRIARSGGDAWAYLEKCARHAHIAQSGREIIIPILPVFWAW